MTRPTRDQWALTLAVETARRATCLRRSVGAVLLSERGHVLATGYNGVASGLPHCNHQGPPLTGRRFLGQESRPLEVESYPHACPGSLSPPGTNLDGCGAIHAEQNALLQCRDVHAIDTCYVTASPCITCVKLLLNTSCRRIVFIEAYPHPQAMNLWALAGRAWEQVELPNERF